MCSANVLSLVESLIDKKVAGGDTFTAYDVTKEARNLTSEQFYHSEVRNSIHDKMLEHTDSGDYQRGSDPVHAAFQYYPVFASPLTSGPPTSSMSPVPTGNMMGISPIVPVSAATALAAVRAPVAQKHRYGALNPNTKHAGVETVGRDARSRLCIPKKFVGAIGCNPGDEIAALIVPKSQIVITLRSGSVKGSPAEKAHYRVDKDGNIRISDKTLTKLGITASIVGVRSSGAFIYLT